MTTTTSTAPNDASTTSTTTATAVTSGTVPTIPSFPDDGDPVPTDDAVVIGTLDNGLAYYIRENRAPGGRAQLRLAVQAGSIQEGPDQRGVAHFLEHMAFNGTERYPANDLITVLSRFGAEFGADVNAYTSYQETVYELELPTDDPETLAAGFDVLFEWATAITLDPAEVELERGVLVEEWRLRDQGFWGRYFAAVTERLLGGTPYEGHEPLGTPDEVAGTTVENLRSFYRDWYRTDTMAVIAVGDFDATVVEALITERFAGIADPVTAEDPPTPTTEPAAEPDAVVLLDPETVQTFVELNHPLPAAEGTGTVGAVRAGMALDLAWAMIVTRLDEAALRGGTAFWSPSYAANPLVRGQRSPGIAAYTDPNGIETTTRDLLTAVERARDHGFTAGELDRAVSNMRGEIQLAFDERATTQDAAFADDYIEHFLGDDPIPSAQDWYELRLDLLDEITSDQVWATFAAAMDATEPLVIVAAPESAASQTPTETEIEALASEVDDAIHEPWADDTKPLDTLIERPEPAPVTDRGTFSDTGLTEITLANGARVVFLQTTIRDDVVVFGAASPGGWSLLDPEDAAEAQMAAAIATASGVGAIDQVTLDRTLSGLVASVTPYVDEAEEGFYGEAATRDLETLFQLVHLYMTAPRFEQVALETAVAETLPFAADPDQVPDLAVAMETADARFGGDPRFLPVPTPEDLLGLDLGTVAEVYRDRFDDPGDFVFVFAGDFDEQDSEDLARSYLGTIPGPGDLEAAADVRPDPPVGIVARVVPAGAGQLGGVTLLFSTERQLDADLRIQIDLLELILQQRLTDRIREELSASYSPFTRADLIEDPVAGVEFTIQVSADPDDLGEVSDETLAVVEALQDGGPTADEMAIASEQLRRDYELISNEALTRAMIFSALHPEEGLAEVVDRIERTYDFTANQIRDLARDLLPLDRYIEVRLVPE